MGVVEKINLLFRVIWFFTICFIEAAFRVIVPPSKKSISAEVILVTGAGHGIGRQLALQLSRLGASIVVLDINKANNDITAAEIKKTGGKAFAYVCDVTSSSDIARVASKVRSEVGEVTILVNNAGILNGAYIEDLDEKAIRRTFEVNTLSHFWMDKEFLPWMKAHNHGHILNVISMAGFAGSETLTDYCASKHGALGLAKSLSIELGVQGYDGIHLTSLCPMVVDTGLLRNFDIKLTPVLTPEEVASAAIDGMLRNYELVTVPSNMYYSIKILNLLPRKAQMFAQKFKINQIFPQYKKDN